MNYCRTCKYWSVNANVIGLGNCLNAHVSLRVISNEHLRTAQNFGCVLHEPGQNNTALYSVAEQKQLLDDYLNALHAIIL